MTYSRAISAPAATRSLSVEKRSLKEQRSPLNAPPSPSSEKDITECHQPPKLFHFKRHEHLDDRRCGLWRIQSGYVRSLTWDSEGELVPLGFWQTGDIVGEAIAQTNLYKAQCLTPVTAEHLGHTDTFSRNTLLSQIRQSNELLQISHCSGAEQRLLSFICWTTRQFGKCVNRGDYVNPLKLTHQEISESIGITRVTVTRLLKVLEQDGCIKWGTREKIVYQRAFRR